MHAPEILIQWQTQRFRRSTGYCKGHAELTLNELRESKALRELFEKTYA